LQEKIDAGLVLKCVKEIKKVLPEPKNINKSKVCERLYKIVKNSDISKISNMMIKERRIVSAFVTSGGEKNSDIVPSRVAEIVCQYLEETAKV
ncbi:MAG: hypothetical protein IKK57_09910, partial [Clostridia bacterium]|nr:hypothetical protein [Clostridia bacterium]